MTTEFMVEGFNYRVATFPNLGRVQLWVQPPNGKWTVDHERVLPEGFDPAEAVELLQRWVDGTVEDQVIDRALPLVPSVPAA